MYFNIFSYLDQDELIIHPRHVQISLSSCNSAFSSLLFTSRVNSVCGFTDHYIYPLKKVVSNSDAIIQSASTAEVIINFLCLSLKICF